MKSADLLEAKAREIVETWSDFKGGSFSGSDLWDLSKKISAALREERERAAKIAWAYDGFGARADVNLAIAAAIRGEDNG